MIWPFIAILLPLKFLAVKFTIVGFTGDCHKTDFDAVWYYPCLILPSHEIVRHSENSCFEKQCENNVKVQVFPRFDVFCYRLGTKAEKLITLKRGKIKQA